MCKFLKEQNYYQLDERLDNVVAVVREDAPGTSKRIKVALTLRKIHFLEVRYVFFSCFFSLDLLVNAVSLAALPPSVIPSDWYCRVHFSSLDVRA